MIYLKSLFLAGCAVIFGATSFAHAEPSAQAQKLPFREDQRAAMEDFVRNFILDNPEILMESVNRFRDKEVKKKEEQSISVLKENMNFLSKPQHPQIGNPKGDITVVEFFDYNCGYCKHALKSVQELTQKDKNVKVVFMEFPILSATSTLASKWALAANMQGKYWAFHQAVLESNSPKDDDNLIKNSFFGIGYSLESKTFSDTYSEKIIKSGIMVNYVNRYFTSNEQGLITNTIYPFILVSFLIL